jgi:hypothetical protein
VYHPSNEESPFWTFKKVYGRGRFSVFCRGRMQVARIASRSFFVVGPAAGRDRGRRRGSGPRQHVRSRPDPGTGRATRAIPAHAVAGAGGAVAAVVAVGGLRVLRISRVHRCRPRFRVFRARRVIPRPSIHLGSLTALAPRARPTIGENQAIGNARAVGDASAAPASLVPRAPHASERRGAAGRLGWS